MNYKWDLTRMFKDEEEYKDTIDKVNKKLDEIIKYKGRILENENTLYELLELDNDIDFLVSRLYVYAYLSFYDNMADVKFQQYKEECNSLYIRSTSVRSFITPELLECDFSLIEDYISKNKKLEKYKVALERMFRNKPHILSEKEEKILSDVSEIMSTPDDAFSALNNVDVKFGKIKDENGEKVELTSSNYTKFLSSKCERVRKEAFKKKHAFYKNHINTLSSLYIGQIKNDVFYSRTRKYNSVLEANLFSDNIDPKLYKTLIKITNKNTKYLKEYYKIKSSSIGKKMHMYDTYLNTSKVVEKDIKYEDAIKLVNEALKPLGEDYLNKFNYLVNNRCVDVFPKDKKRSGAYQWGSYKVLPYVSLNYENNMDSVSTFAHEMGHAMHTYYSDENQDFLYAAYPIFLAEIASTVNEVLLSEYLLKNATDKDEKIYYIIEFLDKFKATVYRQVMFAEFEDIVHTHYENGNSLTKEYLCDTYLKLVKHHFSPSVIIDKDIQYEWSRIPHFYSSYYVYKYATGFISALIIADRLLNDSTFKDKYIKFLSSGGSKYPLELLKDIDIDLTDEKVINKAFELFNDKVSMLKDLESGE
ncbi:MAG: oligoendopeptidase F [Bacilli bacterium]